MPLEGDVTPILRWSSTSWVMEEHEPDDLIYQMAGDVVADDDEENEELIGKFRVYYVDVERAIKEREPLFDVLDAHSSHVAAYFEPIFGSDSPGFSSGVEEAVDFETDGLNLLIIDRLELLPQYRGKGLGLRILKHMIRRFGAGAGIVAMKPFPLQFEAESIQDESVEWRAKLALDAYGTDENTAFRRLRSYYRNLGFVDLPGSDFQVLSTAWFFPQLDTV